MALARFRCSLIQFWLALGFLLTGTACDTGRRPARRTENFHDSYPLPPGGSFSLETFNGAVEVSAWDSGNVDISAEKYWPLDLDTPTQVSVYHTDQTVEVRAVRPAPKQDPYPTQESSPVFAVVEFGARFKVKLPHNVRLIQVTTINAGITIDDVLGPSRLRTSNGAISVQRYQGNLETFTSRGVTELTDVSGNVVVRSSNGEVRVANLQGGLDAITSGAGITATIAAAGPTGRPLHLETSRGPIDLTLPANFPAGVQLITSNAPVTLRLATPVNAHVVARGGNLSFDSEFNFTSRRQSTGDLIDGVIGSGGPTLDIRTSNASIRLLKLSAASGLR